MQCKSFLIAFLATIVRYYDYGLFGLAASKLSQVFLPHSTQDQQLLHFFAIFTIAVYMRPIGSLIFGFIGDHYGRIVSVKVATIISATTTILIGLLPGFSSIGILATFLLLILRMFFLVSFAGEVDAIKIYIGEKASKDRRFFASGMVSCCSQMGALLAALAYHFSTIYPAEELWRVAFLLGGGMGFIIIALRGFYQESEVFLLYKNKTTVDTKENTWKMIQKRKGDFLLAVIINGIIGGMYHFLVIFFSTFMIKVSRTIDYNRLEGLNIKIILVYAFFALIAGIMGDRRGVKLQLIFALFLSIITLLFMHFFINQSPLLLIILGFLAPLYTVPLQVLVQSLFPVNIKMRMISMAHSIGSMLFSSSTPFLCMLIWKYTHQVSMVLVYPLVLIVILLLTSFVLLKKVKLAS